MLFASLTIRVMAGFHRRKLMAPFGLRRLADSTGLADHGR